MVSRAVGCDTVASSAAAVAVASVSLEIDAVVAAVFPEATIVADDYFGFVCDFSFVAASVASWHLQSF